MTGLDPEKDVIVEIATLVTDDELEIVAEGPDLVIATPPELLERMLPVVRAMHTRSGLLPEIEASTVTLEESGRPRRAGTAPSTTSGSRWPSCGSTARSCSAPRRERGRKLSPRRRLIR